MDLSVLSDNKVNIEIQDINEHLWMIHDYGLDKYPGYLATHRIVIELDIDGKGYSWSQFFNKDVVDFCYMTHYAATVVQNTLDGLKAV
jgi:hypothetical protein